MLTIIIILINKAVHLYLWERVFSFWSRPICLCFKSKDTLKLWANSVKVALCTRRIDVSAAYPKEMDKLDEIGLKGWTEKYGAKRRWQYVGWIIYVQNRDQW